MKNTRILSFLFAAVFSVAIVSCSDDFTEEDALNAQQTIDLSVYVVDYFSTTPVSDATVKIIKDGSEVTAQTNEFGIASFEGVKIGGGLPVTVEKEGFTKVQNLVDVDVYDYRQGHFTTTMGVLSLTENTATLKGKLEIETDVTNEDTEIVPEGTEVKALLEVDGMNTIEFTATTDANGYYEFNVPATNNGVDYKIKYPTLVLDQKIAKNGNEGDADFPEVLPSIATISTTFNPNGSAAMVPDVPAIVATLPAPDESNGQRAGVYVDYVNSNGEITDLYLGDYGYGYTSSASSDIAVTITSLFGGSGFEGTYYVNASGEIYCCETINNTGSGYPNFNEANRASQSSPNFTEYVSLQTGEIRSLNGDYGTGTYRAEAIQ